MPRLLLLRHAKSSWAEPGTADRDRPLAPRGREAAKRMASHMAGADFVPTRILCSPARRTRETLAAILPHFPDKTQVAIADELYEPGHDDYRAVIAAHGGNAACLLVIGHNPAIHATALRLFGPADKKTAAQLASKFPTAALAVIEFDSADWNRIRPKGGRLVSFLRPRDLEDGELATDED